MEQKNILAQEEKIIRIASKDIAGNKTLYAGLTKIKGVSWAFSNAICNKLQLDKKRKIGSLSEEEITKIESFLDEPEVPNYLTNRQVDPESGENNHRSGSDLDLQKEFDIKKQKKIKSYKGLRHTLNLPLRGQRTRSHFRLNRRRGSGIKKKVITK